MATPCRITGSRAGQLNLSDPTDGNAYGPGGYTNRELFLNDGD